MAGEIVVTATSVVKGTGATVEKSYLAGEAITAGQACYVKSDGKLWKSQCDGTAAEATFAGIALNGAAAEQPVQMVVEGLITIGATVVAGTIYVVGSVAGGICPWASLATPNYVSVVGYATTSGILFVKPINTGVTIPA